MLLVFESRMECPTWIRAPCQLVFAVPSETHMGIRAAGIDLDGLTRADTKVCRRIEQLRLGWRKIRPDEHIEAEIARILNPVETSGGSQLSTNRILVSSETTPFVVTALIPRFSSESFSPITPAPLEKCIPCS